MKTIHTEIIDAKSTVREIKGHLSKEPEKSGWVILAYITRENGRITDRKPVS